MKYQFKSFSILGTNEACLKLNELYSEGWEFVASACNPDTKYWLVTVRRRAK